MRLSDLFARRTGLPHDPLRDMRQPKKERWLSKGILEGSCSKAHKDG